MKLAKATLKAGTRPLVKQRTPLTGSLVTRPQALQNQLKGCGTKPDPYRVMLQSMRTNPIVHRIVSAPAEVASMIELFPVVGLKQGETRRADPDGSPEERYAWEVFAGYVDDCGSQANLIRRHFEAKGSTGSGVQIRYQHEGRTVYEMVQNVPWIIEQRRDGRWIWHPEPGVDVIVDEAREVYRKGFDYTTRPHSAMMPLVDLLALWELCMKALGEGVNTDLLLGGIIAMPSLNDDWADEFIEWIEVAREKQVRIPFPLSYPMAGKAPEWIEGGGTIQDNIITLANMVLENIARFSPIDAALVLEGVGSGSHWNGILTQRDNLQSFIWPTLRLEVLNDIIAWPFRPALANNDLGLQFDLADWGIGGDWQRLINQPDQGKNTIELVKCGLLKRRTLTGLGFHEDDLLDPSDPEWDDFVQLQQVLGKGDDEAEPVPGGPGSEVFGESPDPAADTSDQPNPTQRSAAELEPVPALVGAEDSWTEFGEW